MDRKSDSRTREERLAAKLRENLRRRKAQVRQMERTSGEDSSESLPKDGSGS